MFVPRLCASFDSQGELAADRESRQLCRGRGGVPAPRIPSTGGRALLTCQQSASKPEWKRSTLFNQY